MNIQHEKKAAYRAVYESNYLITTLIDPEEVDENADSWDDVDDDKLDDELHHAVDVQMSENNQYGGLIKELAIKIWLSEMPRVKLDDLVFETEEKALENEYWPYRVSSMEAESMLHKLVSFDRLDIPNSAFEEASGVVQAAALDKMDPRVHKPKYR